MLAVGDRMSLRKTVLIQIPQHPPPTNQLCQSAAYGFAPDIRSRAALENSSCPASLSAVALYAKRDLRLSSMTAKNLVVLQPICTSDQSSHRVVDDEQLSAGLVAEAAEEFA